MAVSIKCSCDICGKDMEVPQDYNDEDRKTDIHVTNGSETHRADWQNVCNECLTKIRNFIQDINLVLTRFINLVEVRKAAMYYYRQDGGGRKINAIKFIREKTGYGLKESKDLCELWVEKFRWDSNNPLTD
jgi:hypothetical protein